MHHVPLLSSRGISARRTICFACVYFFFYIIMISKANLSQDLLDRFYDFHDFRNLFTNWYHLMIYVLFFFL